jgi:hypothetical protein
MRVERMDDKTAIATDTDIELDALPDTGDRHGALAIAGVIE